MDLNQLAQLGEFVGGVAVLVTLVYLAVQVREVKVANRSAAGDETARSWRENLSRLMDNVDVFQAGATGMASLRGEDALRFVPLIQYIMAYFENFHGKYRDGVVDRDEWERLDQILVWYFSWPGVVECWAATEAQYRPEFVAHIRELLRRLDSGEIPRADLDPFTREAPQANPGH